jgi:hypothetical protein
MVGEPEQHVAQVFMHQAQSAHANGNEQQRLAQLECRNQNQPTVVAGLADGDLGCRVDGFLCRARPNFKRAPIDTLNDTGWFSQERAVTPQLRPVTDALQDVHFSNQKRGLNVDCAHAFANQFSP